MTVRVDELARGSQIAVVTRSLMTREQFAIETVRGVTDDYVITSEHDWIIYQSDGARVIGDRYEGSDPLSFVFCDAEPLDEARRKAAA